MEIMNEVEYHVPFTLRFSLSEYSPLDAKEKWSELKEKCENGNNESITNEWISFCDPNINKSLSFINSLTGGIRKIGKKSCHYRYSFQEIDEVRDDDIVIRYFTNIPTCKWTYTELDDLIFAFEKMANARIGGDYVSGSIIIVMKKYDM